MLPQSDKTLLILLSLVVLGMLLWLGSGAWLKWFGRMPGDIRIERPRFRFHLPIGSMLIMSVLLSGLSGLLWLVQQLR